MPRFKHTLESCIKKFKELHGDFYDYSKVVYITNDTKVTIICPLHGEFLQDPLHHYGGQKCPKCALIKMAEDKKYTLEEFLKISKKIHGDRYDYSKVTEYKGIGEKVTIICKHHGEFLQRPSHHMDGDGCKMCAAKETGKRLTKKQDDFIYDCQKIHKNKFDYSLVNYIKCIIPVIVICKKHGPFSIEPSKHLLGGGCPRCRESKGETKIFNWLTEHNIYFIRQKGFKECKYKIPLHYDFYIPSQNLLIEYDGEQHFKRSVWFCQTQKEFENLIKRDIIKNEYAKQNGFELLRIPYTKFKKIEEILKEKLIV